MLKNCKECKTDKPLNKFRKGSLVCNKCEYQKHKKRINEYSLKYRQENKDDLNSRSRDYYHSNKSKWKKYNKNWLKSKEGKEWQKKYSREWIKKRRRNDPGFKIKSRLRTMVWRTVSRLKKSKSTMLLVGCSIEELKIHLQESAIKNGYNDFTIDKIDSSYHIDHIIPCSSFDLTNDLEVEKCFNWKNLQILSAIDNMKKSDKIISGGELLGSST